MILVDTIGTFLVLVAGGIIQKLYDSEGVE